MTQAFIALGSNVGDRHAALREAVAALGARPRISVVRVATPIETAPVDSPPGAGDFVNSAAELATDLAPDALLGVLLDVERSLGRRRGVRNAPRTIDLDLLLHGDTILHSPDLTLPHPRLHERRFVLAPLAEIAPDALHPTLGRTMRQLLTELDAREP